MALGYDRWNLLGVSYGTRLAQTVLRTHPEGVRSVILDSVYPTASDSLVELPGQMQAAFDHFFAACRADPACEGRYPNLEARFAALVDHLQRQPETVTATDFVSGDDHTVVVTGSDLQDLLFQSLYDPSMFTAVPQLVEDLEAGRTESLTTMESVAVTQLPFLTMNVYVSVQCHEEVAFADPAAVQQATAAHPALAEPLAGQLIDSTAGFRTCQVWDAGSAPPEEDQPVSSDVPALVLSGGFDPITPTAGAREVARTLSRSTFVELPSLGHGVSLEPGCPQDIARAFLADPGCRHRRPRAWRPSRPRTSPAPPPRRTSGWNPSRRTRRARPSRASGPPAGSRSGPARSPANAASWIRPRSCSRGRGSPARRPRRRAGAAAAAGRRVLTGGADGGGRPHLVALPGRAGR